MRTLGVAAASSVAGCSSSGSEPSTAYTTSWTATPTPTPQPSERLTDDFEWPTARGQGNDPALSQSYGKRLDRAWSFDVAGPLAAVYAADTVVVGGSNGDVWSLNPASGRPQRVGDGPDTATRLCSLPSDVDRLAYVDGTLLATDTDDNLTGYALTSGEYGTLTRAEQLWRRTLATPVDEIAVLDGYAYLALENGVIQKVRPESGETVARIGRSYADVEWSNLVTDGTLLYELLHNHVYAFDPDGNAVWDSYYDGTIYFPVLRDGRLFTLQYVDRYWTLLVVDTADGSRVTSYRVKDPTIWTSPTVDDGGTVYVNGTSLQAISRDTGDTVWKSGLKAGATFATPDTLYAFTVKRTEDTESGWTGGPVVALDSSNGFERWRLSTTATWFPPVPTPYGLLARHRSGGVSLLR